MIRSSRYDGRRSEEFCSKEPRINAEAIDVDLRICVFTLVFKESNEFQSINQSITRIEFQFSRGCCVEEADSQITKSNSCD